MANDAIQRQRIVRNRAQRHVKAKMDAKGKTAMVAGDSIVEKCRIKEWERAKWEFGFHVSDAASH